MNFDVIILGAGCAGIALADSATAMGYRCLVLESKPPRGFASIHNQGWLHSGAIYAAGRLSGAATTIEKCKRGSSAFKALETQLNTKLLSSERGLMLFREKAGAELAYEQIISSGCRAEKVQRDELADIEPVLGSAGNFFGGILTDDITVDTPLVLNLLMKRAGESGCTFLNLNGTPFSDLKISKEGKNWRLSSADFEFSGRQLILSCGVLIPKMCEIILSHPVNGKISKAAVLGLNCRATERIIMIRDPASHLMNIAPSPNGVTVNLGNLDDPAEGPDDFQVFDEKIDAILDTIFEFTPGLRDFLPTKGRFWYCQKFEPDMALNEFDGRGRRDAFHSEIAEGLHLLYPGKFTQALTSAAEVASRVHSNLAGTASPESCQRSSGWTYNHPGSTDLDRSFRFEDDRMVCATQG
jgi:glycine/D-amino acid oxidase-like deaminating enzyme